MSLTAPPPPPDVLADRRSVDDLVIKEAKRRARRRRLTYGVAVAVAAVIGVVAVMAMDRTPSSPSDAPAGAPADGPTVAGGADSGTTLIAHWGGVHVGWVLVYSDGRVFIGKDAEGSYPDAPLVRYGEDSYFMEGRLTARGLALVRSGAVPLKNLLEPWWFESQVSRLPTNAWADATAKTHPTPPTYAACGAAPYADSPSKAGASAVLAQLPAAAQALLRGTGRTFLYLPYTEQREERPVSIDCFKLTTGQARALARMSDRPRSIFTDVPGRPGELPASFSARLGGRHHIFVFLALPDQIISGRGG